MTCLRSAGWAQLGVERNCRALEDGRTGGGGGVAAVDLAELEEEGVDVLDKLLVLQRRRKKRSVASV